MAKLVVLSAGLAGRLHELNVDKTTIGRVEDNTFQIAEPSVSSHHCEITLRGKEVVVKDLNSTNGTFINGEKITEGVLKPGQVLRLGQIELRLENGAPPAPGTAPAPATSPAVAPPRTPVAQKKTESPSTLQRGVSLSELEQGPRTSGFDTADKAFSKKTNKANKWIFLAAGFVVVVLLVVILITILRSKH